MISESLKINTTLTELYLRYDEIYKMKCKYNNNRKIIMIINMNS